MRAMVSEKAKEHHGLIALRKWTQEIENIESMHLFADCREYAPGRCPACLRMRMIEQDEIEREMAVIEEDVQEMLRPFCRDTTQKTPVSDAMRLLARADVYRCHPRGAWPHSVAEMAERGMGHRLERMLRRRLFSDWTSEAYAQMRPHVERLLIPCYRQFYHEACLECWRLEQFEHYSPEIGRASCRERV